MKKTLRYKIDSAIQQRILPLQAKERELLEKSILAHGIETPLVVWKEHNILLDGHHRHFIWQRHRERVKLPAIKYLSFKTREEAELWMLENQGGRRNLSLEDLSCLLADATDLRMRLAYAKAGKPVPKNLTLEAAGDDTTEIALRSQEGYLGKLVQQNAAISDRALRIAWELRRDAPEIFAKIKRHETTLRAGYQTHLSQQRAKQLDRAAKHAKIDPIVGKYDVIVTDPPWPLVIKKKGLDSQYKKHGSTTPYRTMTLDEIEAMLGKLFRENTKDDCHIFLWTTQVYLRATLQMVNRWEGLLNYGCCLVWRKNRAMQPPGFPYYNAEFILYLRRGNPKFCDTKNFFVCFDGVTNEHSAKPEEFYATLRRVTSGLRLDHFNRRKIEGFTGWGDESPK